jgi:hypothetical protein
MSQEHAHHFLWNSSWWAKQSIPHTTMTFYGDCVKMCEDFAPNFGDNAAPSHASFFNKEFLAKITLLPSEPTLLFSVSLVGNKTERPPF